MGVDNDLIYNFLSKITKSRHFNKSKISCDLLEYLVKATLNNESPKEFTIGVDLFGKKYEKDDKSDAKIRVYIHNLRRKLNTYYENEGSKDSLIFIIEKGKYRVNFISRKDIKSDRQKTFRLPFFICVTLLLAVSSLYFRSFYNDKNSWTDVPVWKNFVNDDKKTMLVLGDFFVYRGILPTGNVGVYRDFSINSETDFEHMLDKNPELVQTLSRSSLTYLSKMAVFCQNDIQRIFTQNDAGLLVKLLSDLQPTDIKDYNIIFVGNYKNMGLFENIVKELHFNYGITSESNQYIFSSDPCAEVYEQESASPKQTDYPLVIYTEGYNENHYLFFLSALDIGNIATVGQMTSPVYMKQFQKEQLEPQELTDFKALFKVEGINKTDLSSELIRVE